MVRWRVLTLGGALMAGAIAACVVLGQGWALLLPLFAFLVSGVLLGRSNKDASTDAKHGKPRDAMQVFCNGGLYALLAVHDDFHAELWMGISLCTAACDTWASELGLYARWPTVNITTLRRVEPGLSGGISLPGSLGGALGAFLIGLVFHGCAYIGFVDGGRLGSALAVLGIVAASLLTTLFAVGGMLLDSLLGALLQVKYDDGDGPRDSGTRHAGGLRWMTNDTVNLISNALTVAVAWWWLG
jgi:uncharacterized protein (TIGR00297 family)